MKTAVFFITKGGEAIAKTIAFALHGDYFGGEAFREKKVEACFLEYKALVFVMATGIVVRTIAPLLKHKTIDPAVVVVDERGFYAISLLSGHLGGANALAQRIATLLHGQAVITTATDIAKKPAFDLIAKKNGFMIENIEMLKHVSLSLVNGEKVGFFTKLPIEGSLPDCISLNRKEKENVYLTNEAPYPMEQEALLLRPKNLVLGIGCRKGVSEEAVSKAVFDFLACNHKSLHSVAGIASIALKAQEEGICSFARRHDIAFVTFPKDSLLQKESICTYSSFVKERIGVGSVCEAAALCFHKDSHIICNKSLYSGITLALGEILLVCKL